jgi:hypothetical protein
MKNYNPKENRFLQGYACCLASMMSTCGGNTEHKEAFFACFSNMTIKQLKEACVEQSDIEIFKKEGYFNKY